MNESCIEHDLECLCSFDKCVKDLWGNLQCDQSPDKSFRAMAKIMYKWKLPIKPNETSEHLISRIHDMGRIENMLKSILEDDIFDNLSKHNPYYDSEHEVEADKLDDLRRKLSCINDNLWDVMSILKKDD